ncbi:hypothetical protein [Nostoc sp.]
MMKLRHKKTFHPVPSPQSLAIAGCTPSCISDRLNSGLAGMVV